MGIELATIVLVGSMAVLLVLGLPLAFVTGFVALAFAFGYFGLPGLYLIESRIFSFVREFVLVAVPMFILMASVLERSGVARDLYRAMHIWAGGLRGGLAIQTMAVAILMAAMTGIIGGEIILLGLVALPQMLRLHYDRSLAIGTICAGGSLGTMIPPSIVLIIYGLTAGVDIGELFIATIVPGLLLATLYVSYIMVRCHLNPTLGPPAPIEERDLPREEKLRLLRGLVLPIGVGAGVLGSIYLGIASVSEAAGMGALGAIASAWVRRELSWAMLRDALDTGGIWSIARGLARRESAYKTHLGACDQARRGDLDGRGSRREAALAEFTHFFLQTCLDQVAFMQGLIEPKRLQARIRLWVEEEMRTGSLPSQSGTIMDAILYRGELPRGEVAGLTGTGDRQGRRIIAALAEAGVLSGDSSRAPLRIAFPAGLAGRWMPGLFPEA